MLLGLLQEDRALRGIPKDTASASEIRAEIERRIVRGQRLTTSVEIPLSAEVKKVLHFPAEEADRLGQRHVGTEHMLLAILRMEGSLGAHVAQASGFKAEELREKLAKGPLPVSFRKPSLPKLKTLEDFLSGLKSRSSGDLISFFAKHAQVVDVHGKRWNYGEIATNFEKLFVPYAKKNASYVIEETLISSNEQLVAIVLCKNSRGQYGASVDARMTAVLLPDGDGW